MQAIAPSFFVAVPREAVSRLLRHDIPDVMIAGVFLAVGIGAMLLYRLRVRSRDRATLWFGIFAVVYGVRLLITTDAIHVAFGEFDQALRYLAAAITYWIAIPILLVLWKIVPGWRLVLRWALWGMTAFGIVGLLSDAVLRTPESLRIFNSVIVLSALASFLAAAFRPTNRSEDVKSLRAGLLTFGLAIAINNVAGLLRWSLPFTIEPLGLLALLASLGRVLAHRAFQTEERLLALDKELEIARRIQTAILPRQVPGGADWDIAARYLPMTAVAGDFYDFLIVDPRRIGILVADVSGHGIPAALIASMVKIAVAAQTMDAHDPAKVLSGMNRTLCGNLQGQYVTAAYLYLDLEARTMRYAGAGHPALFWQRISGEVEEILENGMMLGLFPGITYTTRESAISPGDRFLLYTDGLLEAEDHSGEFFGSARAKEVLEQKREQPSQDVILALLDRVERWAPSPQDDLTLIAIEWRANHSN